MTDIKHETRAHSQHGASKAHRWMNCAGSVAAEADKPNVSNEHAARGTAAHEVGEMCLKNGFNADRFIGETIKVERYEFVVDEHMAENVQTYLDSIRGEILPGDVLLVEHEFDLSDIHPGMFGTNDACVYKRATEHLIVADYKNGFGLVTVEDNAQLKMYGVGAVREIFRLGYKVKRITLRVVQPNAQAAPVRDWDIDVLDLLDFELELGRAARATMDPNAPRTAGPWCEYCLGAAECGALAARVNEVAKLDFAPVELSEAQMLNILDNADMIEARVSAVRQLAYEMLQRGIEVPGWKLVQGRARRAWNSDSEDMIAEALCEKYGFNRGEIMKSKLKTPTQIADMIRAPKGEKESMRAEFNLAFTTTPPGKVNLVRDADPRTPVAGALSAQSDFKPIGDSRTELLF